MCSYSSFNKNNFIYFIGICGVGMSALAEFLFRKGYKVLGSDISSCNRKKYLKDIGIKIYNRHSSRNLIGVKVVVYSSAIRENNVELVYSLKKGLLVFTRIGMIDFFLNGYKLILIMGCHGKTTITSLLFDLTLNSGLNFNCINGGNIKSINSSIYISSSEYILLEMDESDGEFIKLNPFILILNNIDNDHLNNYNDNIYKLINYFVFVIKKIPTNGYLIIFYDNKYNKYILNNYNFNCTIITYGFSSFSYYRILVHKYINKSSMFTLLVNNNFKYLYNINMYGKHNIINVVAALSCVYIYKNDFNLFKNILINFKGVSRRSEILGVWDFVSNGMLCKNIKIILDYGHHPSEINCNLLSLKKYYKNCKLILVFQPHRFSRFKRFLNEFADVLVISDILFLTNIYSSNEIMDNYIDSTFLLNKILDIGGKNCMFLSDNDLLLKYVSYVLVSNAVVLFQGAGDIDLLLKKFIKKYVYRRRNFD